MSTLGIIFTDTSVLADKYNCRRQEVIDVIDTYIHGCADRGIDWQLVDVGGHDFDYIFSEDVSWHGYSRALADNCAGMGWQTDCNTPLLIIGGDDVIPVPIVQFQDPGSPDMIPLQVDTLFCYPLEFDLKKELTRYVQNGYNKGELYEFFISHAIFNVSRLPLERGEIHFNIHQDLGGYLVRSVASGGAITVDSMLPVTAFRWYISTLKTIENMPLLPLGPNNGCHLSDIFVSPLLRLDSTDPDTDAISEYFSALGKADMLMFNLHGGDNPKMTGFLGQGDVSVGVDERGNAIYEYPLAFDIGLLENCNKVRVINTEACFGARYTVWYNDGKEIPYSRSESMLLSTLYNSSTDILLYVGSCVSASFEQPVLAPEESVGSLRLIHHADHFMKVYLEQQMQGTPAGLAMLKAKWLYYDEIGNERKWDSQLTLLEFNQFGDPTIAVRAPRYNRIHAQQPTKSILHRGAEKVKPFKEKFVPVYSNNGLPELDAAYDDVRSSVDIALMRLSDDLRRMLAEDYHYPSQHLFLSTILRDEYSGGHLYVYAQESRGENERRVYVRVDAAGNVQNITYKN